MLEANITEIPFDFQEVRLASTRPVNPEFLSLLMYCNGLAFSGALRDFLTIQYGEDTLFKLPTATLHRKPGLAEIRGIEDFLETLNPLLRRLSGLISITSSPKRLSEASYAHLTGSDVPENFWELKVIFDQVAGFKGVEAEYISKLKYFFRFQEKNPPQRKSNIQVHSLLRPQLLEKDLQEDFRIWVSALRQMGHRVDFL